MNTVRQYCEQCDAETVQSVEVVGSADNGGGFGHNDDPIFCFTCSVCQHSFEDI
ncbi:hypothetical protein DFP78_113133 [Photobacterium lutimaris]|nr:hypothetical protein DFP78_113133 [Photobacterium lutimaris]